MSNGTHSIKPFGRDPALWIGLIGAAVTVLVAGNLSWIDAGAGAAITTFVSALIVAATTRPWQPALFTGLVAAGAALLAEYGWNLSDQMVTGLSGLILAVFAIVGIRPQVAPKETVLTSS